VLLFVEGFFPSAIKALSGSSFDVES